MPNKLVIVESPAKARTLTRILGKGYEVKASMGHVRDLPKSILGVDIERDFAPKYVAVADRKKAVADIKAAANSASAIYLATDPDREGEAISWHLVEAARLAKDDVPIRRVAFHEITKDAVETAFRNPRSIDMNLVDAQQARRILDRLVGYKLSPLLWRKVRRGLSAGRVQSAALKLIVDREREISVFKPQEYWVIRAEYSRRQQMRPTFWADFLGTLNGKKLILETAAKSQNVVTDLKMADHQVKDVRKKQVSRLPAAPFITSTLQQEASRKLRFTAQRTMRVAQQLYEGLSIGDEGAVGLITYMRTDSTHVATSALAETREFILNKYGPDYLPATSRHFTAKAKFAQEAHEAIRPTSTMREPTGIKQYLDGDQFKLYDLIWKRMVASQMAAMLMDSTTVDVAAQVPHRNGGYLLRTTASVTTFPGFSTLYTEGKDEEDEDAPGKVSLPTLANGDLLSLISLPAPEQRFTQPPPRYTEAALIKALEQKGIGRPSTYASIVAVVMERDYVRKVQGKFHAEELGVVVSDLLTENFPDVANIGFTAHMEEELDEIARGEKRWVPVLREFYEPFQRDLDEAQNKVERVRFKEEPAGEICPQCEKPMVIKLGRFGKFVACTGYPECKTTKPFYVKIGVRCPECGKELVERESKRKKAFWGCIGYPECRFIAGRRPVAMSCPQCSGLLLTAGRDRVKCIKCDYAGPLIDDDFKEQAAISPTTEIGGE